MGPWDVAMASIDPVVARVVGVVVLVVWVCAPLVILGRGLSGDD